MSTRSALPPEPSGGRTSLVWLFSRYWLGIWGMSGMGPPLPKSLGRVVIFCEYLLFTKSAVLSARCGLWGAPSGPGRVRDLLDSLDGRPELDSVVPPMPAPAGIGALICRGALMVGGALFLALSPRFLRREMPFCFSDMVARVVGELQPGDGQMGGSWPSSWWNRGLAARTDPQPQSRFAPSLTSKSSSSAPASTLDISPRPHQRSLAHLLAVLRPYLAFAPHI